MIESFAARRSRPLANVCNRMIRDYPRGQIASPINVLALLLTLTGGYAKLTF